LNSDLTAEYFYWMDRTGMLLRLSVAVDDCCSALREGVHLDEEERGFLESSMLRLHVAYGMWKARQESPDR
jgi:hypothetical protein